MEKGHVNDGYNLDIYQITGAEHDGDKIRALFPVISKNRFFDDFPW